MSIKRARIGPDKGIVGVWQREVGELSTRNFAHRLGASEDLVLRFEILRKLEKHRGCVNTVSFNASGDILVSGSDDRKILLWDWEMGRVKLSFHSGHGGNVFQAKFMPYTNDQTIVTCAADGEVRLAKIPEHGCVKTSLLGSHDGRAHKLAIEPGSPHIFYTSGEDALVQHFDLRTKSATKLFKCRSINDLRGFLPYLHLNAITIDPRNPNFFAIAGNDEYARLYDIRKCKLDGSTNFDQHVDLFCPEHLVGDEQLEITGLAFSDQSELLVSYNDENIYLFTKGMGLGPNPTPSSPVSTTSTEACESEPNGSPETFHSAMVHENAKSDPQVYKGHRNRATVKGVGFFGPKCEYVMSGSDCGRIFIWRKKDGELIRIMHGDKHVVNCIEPHPYTMILASSGIESDIKIWTPKARERVTLPPIVEQVLYRDRTCYFSFGTDDDDVDYTDCSDDDDDEEEEEEDDDDDDSGGDGSFDGGRDDDNDDANADDDGDSYDSDGSYDTDATDDDIDEEDNGGGAIGK
ncbi:hypothetical protein Dimus_002792 [Dionaea muscipula]